MREVELLNRKLERERQARKQAEAILEEKAIQLYKLNEELEHKVAIRTKELRNSEEKYRGIIENMELGLLEVDLNQNIVRAYNWFCDMTGFSQEELVGKNAKNFLLITKEGKRLNENQHVIREKGQAGVYELQIRHKKGHSIWVLISGSPIYDTDGNIIGSLGIHYDITKRKKLEQDLIQAKKIAEEAQEAQKQFLAKMSHEIRTPLNAIIGMSYLLQESNPHNEQKEYLSILDQSSQILKMLVTDILDFSKIQSGEIHIRKSEFNILTLIENLRKTAEIKILDKQIKVRCEIDPTVNTFLIGDELLLNQILINLLGNAVKFTHAGEILILVKVLEESKNTQTIEFQVSDTGIGIPSDKIDVIFKDFKQANSAIQHEYGGTGLGLSITKQLVELQGGEITVKSEINKRTTFSFQLNYIKGKQEFLEESKSPKLRSLNQYKHIELLIAEDNTMNQQYIAKLLDKWEISFEFANDGLETIKLASLKNYDLIFMDISMPKMNGYEATKSIRSANNPNQKTPIIALSALAIIENKEQAFEAGMTDFLGKPFEPKNLLSMLNKYLGSSQATTITKNIENTFHYPEPLNSDHLEMLYQDDYQYAHEMFNIFLNDSVQAFSEIKVLMDKKDFVQMKKEAHKLKPNFSMVGLLKIRDGLEKLESFSQEENYHDKALSIYLKLEQDLQNALPVLIKVTQDLSKIKIHT